MVGQHSRNFSAASGLLAAGELRDSFDWRLLERVWMDCYGLEQHIVSGEQLGTGGYPQGATSGVQAQRQTAWRV